MVIATIKTPGGATVQIDDRYMARPQSDEERRVIAEQRQAARRILERYMEEHK